MRLTHLRSLVILFALPIFARAHVFLGYFLADPIYRFGSIGNSLPGTLPGGATIDPNYGVVDQALTTRAMSLLFSGHFPWWNSLEGFGAPLAGEMQSSAFFPFAPLVLLPSGNLILSVVLAILAGIGMFLLLRRLGLEPWPALVAGILYESCGTFSWLSGSWSYAIPWLPFLILGLEYCRALDLRSVRFGALLIAASVGLLISSGFIETAYLEGLVGVAWAAARCFGIGSAVRARYALGALVGAGLGLALSAPIVVAFADTLAMSFVGMHDASAAGASIPPPVFIQKFVPYVYGPIFASRQADVGTVWGNTGGYLGFVASALGIGGLFGKRYRAVRIVLAIVVILGFAAILGGPLQKLVLLIPGVKYTAYYRYIDPAISFAVCVLCAFALEDVLAQKVARRIALGLVATIGVTAYAYSLAFSYISGPAAAVDADLAAWHVFSLWELGVAVGAMCLGFLVLSTRSRATILGLAACAEALLFLVIPTLSNPTGATIALGGERYLRDHAGFSRFYTFGPIFPNYGSYFGLASLAYTDLPVPARTVAYVKDRLDPLADAVNFLATMPRVGMTQRDNFAQRVGAFESVGVKYVLTPPDDPIPTPLARRRYRDLSMAIYELPNPAPYFSAPGCAITALSRTSVTTQCAAPSLLCRLELNAPGWTADVDGRSERPGDCGEIFESVNVPSGTSHVSFRFVPPYEPIALVVAAIAFAGLLALALSLGVNVTAFARSPRVRRGH